VATDDIGTVVLEGCRLAMIIMLSAVRRAFGVVVITATEVSKLYSLLTLSDYDWLGLEDLRFWVVVMGVLEVKDLDQRRWFGSDLRRLLLEYGITTRSEASDRLRGVIWTSSVFAPKLQTLPEYSVLRRSHGYDLGE
jgi:hypothetical protein